MGVKIGVTDINIIWIWILILGETYFSGYVAIFYNPQQPYHHKSLWAQNVYMLPSQESDHNWEVDWSHISECVLVMVVGWLLPNWS